ncbi:hypothetical protein M405DRAFT_196394 [Rhizopogon salebrosus TDB-379]|nr:hypothetical protein M405DRAFT_196394 [Rhizopogon salebrosus TDB-379]
MKLWAWACATLPPIPAGYPYPCRTLTVPVGVERWDAFGGLLVENHIQAHLKTIVQSNLNTHLNALQHVTILRKALNYQ